MDRFYGMLTFYPSIVADRWVHSTYAFLRFRVVLVFNQNSGCTQLVCHIVFNQTGATVSLSCPDELAQVQILRYCYCHRSSPLPRAAITIPIGKPPAIPYASRLLLSSDSAARGVSCRRPTPTRRDSYGPAARCAGSPIPLLWPQTSVCRRRGSRPLRGFAHSAAVDAKVCRRRGSLRMATSGARGCAAQATDSRGPSRHPISVASAAIDRRWNKLFCAMLQASGASRCASRRRRLQIHSPQQAQAGANGPVVQGGHGFELDASWRKELGWNGIRDKIMYVFVPIII